MHDVAGNIMHVNAWNSKRYEFAPRSSSIFLPVPSAGGGVQIVFRLLTAQRRRGSGAQAARALRSSAKVSSTGWRLVSIRISAFA
jgi:hypothetical protein